VKRHFKFCLECRRTITPGEMEQGRYSETQDGLLCADCAPRMGFHLVGTAGRQGPASGEAASTPSDGSGAVAGLGVPPGSPTPATEPRDTGRSKPGRRSTAVRASRPAPPPQPAAPPEHLALEIESLKRIVEKLERLDQRLEQINRLMTFERASPWNLFAAVAQVLAVGMLVIAAMRWLARPLEILLVALIFQAMALTFFLKGK